MTGLIAVFLFVLLIAASGVIAFLLIAYFQAKAQRTEVDGQLAHVQQTLEQVKSHAQNAYDTYRSAAESKIRELSASVQKLQQLNTALSKYQGVVNAEEKAAELMAIAENSVAAMRARAN